MLQGSENVEHVLVTALKMKGSLSLFISQIEEPFLHDFQTK